MGRKTSNRLKVIRGTDRRDRRRLPVVPALTGAPVRPAWLSPAARCIWDERVKLYRLRGQPMRGFEDFLGHYAELEARVRKLWQSRRPVRAALLAEYLKFSQAFYDTPASQEKGRPKDPRGDSNPFASHGKPPTSR